MWAVDHLIDHIIRGFVTELAIDTTITYSKVKCELLKGPRGKYLKYMKTWIKMLCEKWAMPLP